ncbi:longitudinals lacking protein, isoforms A/B/D/L [Anopheles ziemanni]|uniref:longitudinals lacking protein, isoforms A/B/D/L n=1 Tax=Anopheles coustani TaxID=139045 RepID=UPI00265B3375|nr:longitudinals lacking protein, isoforms A/B/D/L [Anopheles coustani]XP_058174153.1 longitudinals lacking protein, isoforms A/B/D/L [Anopheles ziemanni]
MGSSEGQTYCLRWNNHKSNLVEILDALIKMECYVDCTIYVDEQVQFKAHRVVLAANSPYFQSILQDVPMDHCTILFPGVQEFEMRALLEYMYTGEVNVTQAQIPRIMKIAEQLEVKGLYDMADLKGRFEVDHPMGERGESGATLLASNNNYSTKGDHAGGGPATASSSSSAAYSHVPPTSSNSAGYYPHHPHHQQQQQQHQSSPVISTSTNISIAQSSSSSPPYSYKSPYSSLYSRSPGTVDRDREREERSRDRSSSFSHPATSPHRHPSTSTSSASSVSAQIAMQAQAGSHPASSHQSVGGSSSATSISVQPSTTAAAAAALAAGWPGLGQTQLHSMLSSAYDSSTDMNPLKRKKLQSMSSMLRDTPILRNVLAQANPADSSQPGGVGVVPAGTAAGSVATIQTIQKTSDPDRPSSHHSNGSGYKSIKEPSHSPYADKSYDDDLLDSPHNFGGDARLASYVPHQQQKPEWKRYKQYTRTDILNAIDCVRKGMSALQASRKFGVPSRTLYDKVKKLGITTGRPINRSLKRSPSSGGSPASFPYGLSGTSHMFGPGAGAPGGASHSGDHHHQQLPSQSQQQDDEAMAHHEAGRMIKLEHGSHHGLPPTIPHPAAALLDPSFLQQALEARGGDIAGREALHAMAFAAAAHAAVNGMSTSPGTHGTARSPSPNVLMKYMRSVSMSSPEDDRHHPAQHQHPQQHRDRAMAEGQPPVDGRHHNGSETAAAATAGYVRRQERPMEQDSIDDAGSDCGGRPNSVAPAEEGQDDHVEDLSMGTKRDSEDRGPSMSPPLSHRVSQRSRSPSPQAHAPPPPPPQPQQQGVIVPAPGKLKEDYNISIKREIIADSNAPSESS